MIFVAGTQSMSGRGTKHADAAKFISARIVDSSARIIVAVRDHYGNRCALESSMSVLDRKRVKARGYKFPVVPCSSATLLSLVVDGVPFSVVEATVQYRGYALEWIEFTLRVCLVGSHLSAPMNSCL